MSEAPTDGGPAFPCVITDRGWLEERGVVNVHVQPENGMSLRDFFAGKAIPALVEDEVRELRLMSNDPNKATRTGLDDRPYTDDSETYASRIASEAYLIADAMLRERAKGGAA